MSTPRLRFKHKDGTEYPKWEEKQLGALCYLRGRIGFRGYTRDDLVPEGQGAISLSPTNIVDGFVVYKDCTYLSFPKYEESPEIKVSIDDILFTKTGSTVGKIGFVKELPDSATINPQIALITAKSINPYYLFCAMLTEKNRKYIQNITVGGAIPTLSQEKLKEMTILLPCPEEQQKIADFFSTVDEVITQSEAEVQNLEQQKKVAMQKIFSQEVRFKREDGTEYPEWEETDLNSIGSFYGGLSGKTKEDFGKGNSKFVTYMNVYKNVFASQEMLEFVDVSDNEKQNKVQYGDLLMTQSSETVEEVGMSSIYLFRDEPYLNSFCFGLHLYNLDYTYPMYTGYLMRSEPIRKQIMREGQGISRINLSPNRIRGIILPIPCLEEQQKIADFLSAYDEAISYAKQELDKWKELKKGLLQQMFV